MAVTLGISSRAQQNGSDLICTGLSSIACTCARDTKDLYKHTISLPSFQLKQILPNRRRSDIPKKPEFDIALLKLQMGKRCATFRIIPRMRPAVTSLASTRLLTSVPNAAKRAEASVCEETISFIWSRIWSGDDMTTGDLLRQEPPQPVARNRDQRCPRARDGVHSASQTSGPSQC